MAICVQCAFKNIDFPDCNNRELPITDFVSGKRDCDELNHKGDCKGFKVMVKLDSIYESKEDEDLAKTNATD